MFPPRGQSQNPFPLPPASASAPYTSSIPLRKDSATGNTAGTTPGSGAYKIQCSPHSSFQRVRCGQVSGLWAVACPSGCANLLNSPYETDGERG